MDEEDEGGWVATSWLVWGVLPFLAVNVGFWCTALPLEYILHRVLQAEKDEAAAAVATAAAAMHAAQQISSSTIAPRVRSWWTRCFRTVKYDGVSRAAALAQARARLSFKQQLRAAAWQISGPMAIGGAAAGAIVIPLLVPRPSSPWPTLRELFIQLTVMELAGDFALYWGHRVQHESTYLWQHFHCHHHTVRTPSPISTLYIDSVDATLQATLPLFFGGILAQPHPVCFAVYCCVRVAENTLNHSGMESPLLTMLSLKFLPLRASASFHDYHHRYSNYAGKAKNYSENFVIWDWIFGTANMRAVA
eukprot:COSAG01_NODE_16849_length_1199_cov_2.138182_1_plen_306_part_00